MTKYYPQRVANDITRVLRTVGAADFPVDVRSVAVEISKAKFPDDPIVVIKGDVLPGFEGGLSSAPPGKNGWGIIYNSDVSSRGRINFTLGHEFGHYMLHRKDYPNGFHCSTEDLARWGSEYRQRENEANVFAATLLMPFDDFRDQINEKRCADFNEIGSCAERYDVSLVAATLRWLQYTSRRSMLVVSREGFILWARSSQAALKSGLYYKTSDRPPIEIPEKSLAATSCSITGASTTCELEEDVWLSQPCTEQIIISDQYDFTLSLLHFPDIGPKADSSEEPIEDTANRMRRRTPSQSWLT